ncbi:MAG: helix-turn-helix transcriptional regulator [Ottowia sp.]|uniref:AraC family transcriptional regulator n=1 Tax=unclassified Ottowia TaxID=2645081 RepID=UPI003C2FF89E
MSISPHPDIDASLLPVTTRATDYAGGTSTGEHHHPNHHQLIHSMHGVMAVTAEAGRWIVPPTRALWMPAGMTHRVSYLGEVQMRSLFVRPDAAPGLASHAQVVGISPLLRELIRAAMGIPLPYEADSRDGRLMRLLLDELRVLPVLPMHLPHPADPRLQRISQRLEQRPDDPSTLEDWAERIHVNPKTLQRLFARDTGMSFGRWRQQARLLHALERLAQGERVIDVALAAGYDSPGAFATMFKRHFGQSPSAFFR